MTQSQLTKRVEELEREVREMKSRMERGVLRGKGASDVPKTSRDFIGMFRNDQDFKEAMELGAAYRRSLRPAAGRTRARKK